MNNKDTFKRIQYKIPVAVDSIEFALMLPIAWEFITFDAATMYRMQ